MKIAKDVMNVPRGTPISTPGSLHPLIAEALNGLGSLYREQGKYKQAEALLQRALHICEQKWGPDHPQVASVLSNLSLLYQEQDEHEQFAH